MPAEIIDDVYDLTHLEGPGRRYRAYLVDGETPTLVDTSYPETADRLLEEIEAVGVAPERLLITHGDGDHFGGFDAVVESYPVETWAPAETNVGDVDVDHRFADSDPIGRFEAIHVPGHSTDCYAFVDEDAGLLLTGDVLVGSDLRGLPSGYLLAPPEVYSQDVNAAEEGLDRVLKYDFDVALTFHGTAVLDDAKEKLDNYVNFPRTPL